MSPAGNGGQPPQSQPYPGRTGEMTPLPRDEMRDYAGRGLLDGARALVTGGDSGIGRAVAVLFAREGADVAIVYLDEGEDAKATKAAVEREGRRCLAIAGDVGDEGFCRQVIERTVRELGRLDVLVNNAGVGIGAAAGEHLTKRVDMQLDVNVRAIVLFYRECLDMLRAAGAEHKSALVVNMSSIAGTAGQAWLSVYAATKFAVRGYTQSMNKELAAEGIKSVAFCPGFVDTDMTDFVKGQIPAEEMIRPDDIAEAVRFLLRLSPAVVVPEIVFARPGEGL
jgi:NAD(P)-dependent dehydrogenase (short-subunit alcohol dehydrogenase family)